MRIGSVSHSLLMLIAGGTVSLILVAGSARARARAQADLMIHNRHDSLGGVNPQFARFSGNWAA